MKEYICKEDIRNKLYDEDAITMRGVDIINNYPAADVQEVVYCKDCLHFSYDDVEGGWCDVWGNEVGSPNFYCADAYRREEQT